MFVKRKSLATCTAILALFLFTRSQIAQDIKTDMPNQKPDETILLKEPKVKPLWSAPWNTGHPFVRSSNGFKAHLNGYIQLDVHGHGAKSQDENRFAFRRARIGVDGTIYRDLDFKIQADFSDLKNVSLRDAYLRYRVRDEFQLWFGQLKEPWGQEELHGDSALEFVERSMVNNLTPFRSLGIILSGSAKKGIFEYQLGAFSGNRKLSRETGLPPEGAVRLSFSPWKPSQAYWSKGISFGAAYAQSHPTNGQSVRGRSASRSTIFFRPAAINGKAIRTNAELSWLAGPASFRAEYDQTNQSRTGLGPGGTNLPGVVAKGYMAQFTYLLTGETKPDSKTVKPKNNFLEKAENGRRGFGAWELKLRYDNLKINDSTEKSNGAQSIYFGANWYLNPHVRYLLDFGFEQIDDRMQTNQLVQGNSFVMLSRIQFAF